MKRGKSIKDLYIWDDSLENLVLLWKYLLEELWNIFKDIYLKEEYLIQKLYLPLKEFIILEYQYQDNLIIVLLNLWMLWLYLNKNLNI